MGKKKGSQLAYAFYTVLYVAADRKRFKLGDTEPERFSVCSSTAYRILRDLVQQEILERQGKKYRIHPGVRHKLTGIEFQVKRQLISQVLEYLNRAFKIPIRLFVAHDVRKDMGKILDIPDYLTQDLAAGILNPPQPEQEHA